MVHRFSTTQNVETRSADQPRDGGQHRPREKRSKSAVAKPEVSNTNSENGCSHDTAHQVDCISKLLHVLAPKNTSPIIYSIVLSGFYSSTKWPCRGNPTSPLAWNIAIRGASEQSLSALGTLCGRKLTFHDGTRSPLLG